MLPELAAAANKGGWYKDIEQGEGLETNHALILNADIMNAINFYVAISRALHTITIFSGNACKAFLF